jgi:hypothetical protein
MGQCDHSQNVVEECLYVQLLTNFESRATKL